MLEIPVCPLCGTAYRMGEFICPTCNNALTSNHVTIGKTRKVPQTNGLVTWKVPSYDGHIMTTSILTLCSGEAELILPTQPSLIVGRASAIASDPNPDIDLTSFDAISLGVSRRHIRIIRDTLIYVTDLGSSNGTFINGQRLFPNTDYVLNDEDDLRLGRLKLRVRLKVPIMK